MRSIILLFILSICCVGYLADARDDVSKDYRKEAKRFKFTIRTQPKFNRFVTGRVIPVSQIENELGRFFQALDELGESFVRKSGLKAVMICDDLKLNGMDCAGVASGDCMYLRRGFSKKTVYHEMFHIFDPKRGNKKWQNANHKDFRYRGIDFPDKPLSKKQKKNLQKHYNRTKRNFDADFVSKYAQSSEVEDRAETFAIMIEEGRYFIKRANKSPYLHKKMMLIIEMTDRSSLLGKAYWQQKLGINLGR